MKFIEESDKIIKVNPSIYEIDKILMPGVTTILKVINPAGIGLKKFTQLYGQNSDFILELYGELGSNFHRLAEDYLNGELVLYENLQDTKPKDLKNWIWERFSKFVGFWDKYSKDYEIVKTEHSVYNKSKDKMLWYAGTLDCVLKDKDGFLHIFDWKTSNTLQEIYWEQLAAYAYAYEYMTGSEIATMNIAWFPQDNPNKSGYRVVTKPKPEIDEYFEEFIFTFKKWNRYHRPKELKQLEIPKLFKFERK